MPLNEYRFLSQSEENDANEGGVIYKLHITPASVPLSPAHMQDKKILEIVKQMIVIAIIVAAKRFSVAATKGLDGCVAWP